jgi:hypothetical protein
MKKVIFLLASIFAFNFAAFAFDKPISANQLPQAAQSFISKHFAGKNIALAQVENGLLEKSYDVIFSSGEKVEFDRKGEWTDIDCHSSEVPAQIVPKQIADYVSKNHKGVKIIKIERERNRYDIDLSNDWEITFDGRFNVVDIDR